MPFLREFREFAVRGNMIDLAVGIIVRASFNKIVDVFVHGILMPPLGYLTGGLNFADKKIVIRKALFDPQGRLHEPENAIKYGEMIQAIIIFIITAFAVFVLIKGINILRKRHAEKGGSKEEAPTAEEKLLMEIRDLLKKQSAK
ncbi:MAG TPA: large-conductance mechanosensitive channel protein MscL [Bacteroidia bacterium]|jgi:large conductance mechanosensitive channel